MAPNRAFMALQDRSVTSLALACCPTMDLIAFITLDHHLLVHRTTSWQKMLHIHPSDVGLKMMTLSWKPDGLQLGVGCDGGDVVIFDIESGTSLPKRCGTLCHKCCITAMHWVELSIPTAKKKHSSSQRNVSGAVESVDAMSHPKFHFRSRAQRFFSAENAGVATSDTLLVTADEGGCIALWWMGTVLLTRLDVMKHFTDEEFRALDAIGQPQHATASHFRIERVKVAPDLSLVFVLLVFYKNTNHGATSPVNELANTKLYRMLTLNITAIQQIHEDVALVASSIDRVYILFNAIASHGKQMKNEWKAATTIFELKMGLIGSLYEKYACEDSPQSDMLSMLVTGITPPALAQYFAQDIQEMSIYRMEKALFSGCDSLRRLIEGKLKHNLVEALFYLSELRGHAKWNPQNYASTLGVTIDALDALTQTLRDTLIAVEALQLAIHETLQDFALFFQWILECTRIHSNTNRPGSGTSGARNNGADAANNSKSLLNLRRLCDFLQRATESAHSFRKQQDHHNVYKVETTFGNPVSLQLSAQPLPTKDSAGKPTGKCLDLMKQIQDQWLVLLDAVNVALAQTIRRVDSGCFSLGNTSNSVEECHIHLSHPFSKRKFDHIAENDDPSDDDETGEEIIDWNSLRHYGNQRDDHDNCCTVVIGFRLRSDLLLLRRVLKRVDSQLRHESPSRLTWDAAVISFSQGVSTSPVVCRGFNFYGSPDKQEQLACVLECAGNGNGHIQQEWLCLQSFDNIQFLHASPTVSFEVGRMHRPVVYVDTKTILAQGATYNFTIDRSRGRIVATFPTTSQSNRNAASVVTAASRGVVCVIVPPSRLTVFDVEDDEDDEDDEDFNS
ncbi:hypothetical protein PsorP6_005444 [Peronosclerospora sorghi]|uniref:Uncharacterized protein n=1 Tax=Peronosclerospora sorghi TaxID=230839 RepID=A0ACC0W3M6_9STRA|nr:hypothetical protein PsorP6_005444 [Peronosclerospora sorghi]